MSHERSTENDVRTLRDPLADLVPTTSISEGLRVDPHERFGPVPELAGNLDHVQPESDQSRREGVSEHVRRDWPLPFAVQAWPWRRQPRYPGRCSGATGGDRPLCRRRSSRPGGDPLARAALRCSRSTDTRAGWRSMLRYPFSVLRLLSFGAFLASTVPTAPRS